MSYIRFNEETDLMSVYKNMIDQLLTHIAYPHTILLDMQKTARHWLLGYEYFIIRPDHQIKDLAGKT